MRRRSSKRPSGSNKKQPKVREVPGNSVEVVSLVRQGNVVTITFNTVADAMNFYGEFKLQMDVDTVLADYPDDEMDGVLRTLKVKK